MNVSDQDIAHMADRQEAMKHILLAMKDWS